MCPEHVRAVDLAALTPLKTPQAPLHDVGTIRPHPLAGVTDRRSEVFVPTNPRHVSSTKASVSDMKDKCRHVGSAPGAAPAVELADRTQPGPVALAEAMRSLTQRAADDPRLSPFDLLVRSTVDQVPGATSASITVRLGELYRTAASTSDTATRADLLQYEIGFGPAIEVVRDDHFIRSDDVTLDGRWGALGLRAHEETGVASALSFRLTLLSDSAAIAALNLYSEVRGAFDETSVSIGLVLATHGSMLVTAMLARDRADNLMRALESNRDIGVAMGILMQRHRLTREQAFDILRTASQHTNRKLADIATEVADTGLLPDLRRARQPRRPTASAGGRQSSTARWP